MILTIVKYPDPVLQQPGEPVTEFDDKLRKFVADMFETMYAAQGIGLAAPQVAVSKRITVIDLSNAKDPAKKMVLINPEIIFSKARSTKKKAASVSPKSARKSSDRLRCAFARRTSTENGSRPRAKNCSHAACSTKLTIWTACSSYSASAASNAIWHCARFAKCNAPANGKQP